MQEAKSCLVEVLDVWVELISEGDAIVRRLLNGKGWESETRAAWRSLVVKGKTVIDVGAYTGIYSIASALMGAHVVALEPHMGNYHRLCANVVRNNIEGVTVLALHEAASFEEGDKPMYAKRWGDPCDTASFISDGRAAITVKAIRLDQLRPSPVCLIKIDVEQHEVLVLLGAIGVISAHKPKIIVETLSDSAAVAVKVVMSGLGYTQQARLDGRNELWVNA